MNTSSRPKPQLPSTSWAPSPRPAAGGTPRDTDPRKDHDLRYESVDSRAHCGEREGDSQREGGREGGRRSEGGREGGRRRGDGRRVKEN